ncbi:MAG: Gfo/Idh/MocA family oxidoreductase [Candidatus Sumerlaeota bacterium]|nr:Gfo/Idh/MocA family oxidoreductase [Candidatus Sumerlaeota bacterium]
MRKQSISRRELFKKGAKVAAAAGAGAFAIPYVITSTALGQGTIPPASERVTVCHIGIGGQGSGLMGHFLGLDLDQSVAVCDPFTDRREDRAKKIEAAYAKRGNQGSFKGVMKFNDFREAVARPDIDACVIATHDLWHVPIALAAVKAGKDIYVEKPLGICIEWNKALREAVHRYGRIFQYGTQQRSDNLQCRFGCELVRNGRIGEIKAIEVIAPAGASGGSTEPIPVPEGFDYDMWLGPAPLSPYTKDRCTSLGTYHIYDNSIGFIAGWGAHPLDIMHWGYPEIPVEYEGTGEIPTEGLYTAIKTWDVRGKFKNGMPFTFTPGGDRTTFRGTEGWVAIWRGGIDAEPKSLLKSVIKPDEIHLGTHRDHKKNFLECVKSRATPASDIDSACQSDFISHLGDICIRTGRKIKWDLAKETIVGDDQAQRMMNRAMREPWRL